VSPVKYKLGFYIPEDGVLHGQSRGNLTLKINDLKICLPGHFTFGTTWTGDWVGPRAGLEAVGRSNIRPLSDFACRTPNPCLENMLYERLQTDMSSKLFLAYRTLTAANKKCMRAPPPRPNALTLACLEILFRHEHGTNDSPKRRLSMDKALHPRRAFLFLLEHKVRITRSTLHGTEGCTLSP
jgi:hypothetical protein